MSAQAQEEQERAGEEGKDSWYELAVEVPAKELRFGLFNSRAEEEGGIDPFSSLKSSTKNQQCILCASWSEILRTDPSGPERSPFFEPAAPISRKT